MKLVSLELWQFSIRISKILETKHKRKKSIFVPFIFLFQNTICDKINSLWSNTQKKRVLVTEKYDYYEQFHERDMFANNQEKQSSRKHKWQSSINWSGKGKKLFIRSPTLLPFSGNNPVPSVSVFLLNPGAIERVFDESDSKFTEICWINEKKLQARFHPQAILLRLLVYVSATTFVCSKYKIS